MAILLGFDTGGTYTDAVLYDETTGVLASAKALTTKDDLSIGLGNALRQLPPEHVATAQLVSVSTTLATNAMIEALATPAALFLIGQDERALGRAGLGALVGDGPVVFLAGGHTGTGKEVEPLDEDAVRTAIRNLDGEVEAFAVAGYFSVRNPAHEDRVRDLIREMTDKPVTCSHELSSNLDAPRRALTTLINARLISLLQGLILSVQSLMAERNLKVPLMVVRGDGSLISATSALERPVETILSGPAASVIGASHLSGETSGIVSDMGGTTTDVVAFENGRPTVNRDGAMVGGWRTMVEAVNVRTYGLGGDSEVSHDENAHILLGPRRVVPLALLGQEHPEVLALLKKQTDRPVAAPNDGRFAVLLRDPDNGRDDTAAGAGRKPGKTERQIFEKLRVGPTPLHQISALGMGETVLARLVSEGKVIISAFTPSDASHVLDIQNTWNKEAAALGATLYLRRLFDLGHYFVADDAVGFCRVVFERAVVESAKTVTGAVLAEHYGIEPEVNSRLGHFLLETATRKTSETTPGPLDITIELDRPLLAIGAPAAAYYGGVTGAAARINASLVALPHADVANAVGAVVGSVKGEAQALITEPEPGRFRVHSDIGVEDFPSLGNATEFGEKSARDLAESRARKRGASEIDTIIEHDDIKVEIVGGGHVFVESKLTATSRGRPDLGTKSLDS